MSYVPTSNDLPTYAASKQLLHRNSWDPATQTYNINPTTSANFRLALAKAKASVTPCNVDFHGDSITSGYNLTTRQTNAWPEQVRALFQASGRWGNVYEGGPMNGGDGTSGTGANDTRLTWTTASSGSGLGAWGIGGVAGIGGNGGGVITFGAVNCDTFDVYDRQIGLGASSGWDWKVDGGGSTHVSQAATGAGQGNRKTTISAGAYGSHTLTITLTNLQYGIINGIGVRKSTDAGGVYMRRTAVGGLNIGDGSALSSSIRHPVSQEYLLTTVGAPALAVISLGTNPEGAYVTADWKINMKAWVQAVQAAGGDVLLTIPAPGGAGVNASQVTYLAAIAPLAYEIADETNCMLLDWFWRWGGVYTSTMDQYFQPVGASGHTNQAGANDQAFGVYNALTKIA